MAIKFTSQTITCNNETIFIDKIIYIKKTAKSYKKDNPPRFTKKELIYPKKLALLIFILYIIHFYVGLNFYFIGDFFCIYAMLECLLLARKRVQINKATQTREIKKAYFIFVKWGVKDDEQINLASEKENQITDLFKYLSDLYYGEVKGPFEADAINNYFPPKDGEPCTFYKGFDEFNPSDEGGKSKKSDQNLLDVFNDSLDNLVNQYALWLEKTSASLRNFWKNKSFRNIKLPRRGDK